MSNVMANEPQQITVQDRTCIDRKFNGTTDGANLTFLQRHIEYPDHWIEMRAWTTVSRFDESLPVFERILNSIRVE